jgi:hypothetical protein
MNKKREVKDWSIEELSTQRTQILFPDFQREKRLWSTQQKALLIDSILRDIDIPKLYFNRNEDGDFEVVDGQQRLWAIWDFFDNAYTVQVEGKEVTFRELKGRLKKTKDTIEKYTLQITILNDADEDYLRELFLRLQFGLLLNTGEKLHAGTGEMKDLVFDNLAKHNFVQGLGIPKKRYAPQTLCAQIVINSFTRAKLDRFERTRYEDLLHFFQEYQSPQGKDRSFFESQAKKISAVLDQLWLAFGSDAKSLRNRSYILSLYLLFEELAGNDGKVSEKVRKKFADFALTLWRRLREEATKGFNRANEELYEFETYLSSAPGERYQIERRHKKLKEYYNHFKKTGEIIGD